tara:strand:+ start:234 stop:425 length:192 start_codon:yes stop_codon:yes gene_type:complete
LNKKTKKVRKKHKKSVDRVKALKHKSLALAKPKKSLSKPVDDKPAAKKSTAKKTAAKKSTAKK